MLALITTSLKSIALLNQGARVSVTTPFDRVMVAQHACPCCSYVLLRHIGAGGVYWRCSHCHEIMPIWS